MPQHQPAFANDPSHPLSRFSIPVLRATALALAGVVVHGALLAQSAPHHPITSGQRSTAQQVAQAGVPLSDLAPNAPGSHTVQRGDTLWDISALFLKHPWRWPELWGMNLQQIRNPHLIYPGQVLVLTIANGRATLSVQGGGGLPTVKLSPRVRAENLAQAAIPPIPLRAIEPFLTDSLIVDETTHQGAARIVATPENRVLVSKGERAYVRGQSGPVGALQGEALADAANSPRDFRVYRNAVPIKAPGTNQILGYEAQFIGKAALVRPETVREGGAQPEIVPATVDITLSKEEMRVGDRLLPEPPRTLPVYIPRAPEGEQRGQVVAVHGAAVNFAGQNQVVIVNRGRQDGLETGHVLAILKDSATLTDNTDAAKPRITLPSERNGLMMVFRTFDTLSYALVLQITDGVKVGDRFSNP